MEPENHQDKGPVERTTEEFADVTREELCGLVWAEPMLKVAARFGVSSSYMARICTVMNVPRPERGYWAKLAVGKHSPKPGLPEARAGDQIIWNRSGVPQPVHRPLPRPPSVKPRRKSTTVGQRPEYHPLIHGAKIHFEEGRTWYDSQYPKPAKRLLVDLVVSKTGLDKALGFANDLFRELEAHDCRVVIAPNGEHMRRATVDEHEVPQKRRNDGYYHHPHLWLPGRITVTYVGTVAIGLTVIELSEDAEARYVKGEYVRVDALTSTKGNRYLDANSWTTKKQYPTGRLCLQAYCPDWRAEWTHQWRETKDSDLTSQISTIVRDLFDAAPVLAELIKEGEREAELRRQEWEREQREFERKEAEERAAKARRDSHEELLQIVDAWAQANRITQFFLGAESALGPLDRKEQMQMHDRLRRARELLGSIDALERFRSWKSPEERTIGDNDD